MSGGAGPPSNAAPVVTADLGQSESTSVRGGQGTFRETAMEMEEDSGSELTELEEMEEEEWEGKGRGRPNFKRAAPGAGQQQSTPDFFRHGNRSMHADSIEDDIFSTPGRPVMRGALARSLSAAASSPQQVGTVETPKTAKSLGMEGGKLDVGAGDWAEEVANEIAMEGVADSDRLVSPTPARWATPTPAPTTPTKGNKRMALGTPRPPRRTAKPARPPPVGFAAAAALVQILEAVAQSEQRTEERAARREERLREALAVAAADAAAREERVLGTLLADAKAREDRLAVKLLAVEAIEDEQRLKSRWDVEQWEDMAGLMTLRREESREIKRAVDEIRGRLDEMHLQRAPAAAGPTTRGEAMQGVEATLSPVVLPMGESSAMEGVEREGLFASQHAPELDAQPPALEEPEKGKGKEKAKTKSRQPCGQPDSAHAGVQWRGRQDIGEGGAPGGNEGSRGGVGAGAGPEGSLEAASTRSAAEPAPATATAAAGSPATEPAVAGVRPETAAAAGACNVLGAAGGCSRPRHPVRLQEGGQERQGGEGADGTGANQARHPMG
jgi:hypothetical protein